jgi:cobalt/nickel transport system permease protein
MTLAVEQLPHSASPARAWDPRWKLAALTLAALAVTLLQTVWAALLALLGASALAVWGRLPRRWFLARLGSLGLVLLLFVVVLPFWVRDGGPGWDLGPVYLSQAGVRVALVVCLKALTVVSLMLVLVATAPLPDLLKAAHALRLPGLVVQLAMLTYRYIFVLASELARLRVALRVRGYRNRATRHSYRTVGHVAGTLLVRGSERAERVGQAMRCRGFDGHFRSLTEFRTTRADVGIFALVLLGAVGLLVWDWLQR